MADVVQFGRKRGALIIKVKPFRITVIFALGLCLPAAVGLGQRLNETTQQGKTVEEWFQEYVADAVTRISPTSPAARNGEFMRLSPDGGKPDPAWLAFQALGEKAVPCLVLHLRPGSPSSNDAPPADKPPTTSQPKLLNEDRRRLERRQAIELIHRLGVAARAAAPTLLALLRETDRPEEEEVCAALQSIHFDEQVITEFLLELGKQRRDADVLRFAGRLGWNGPEVARLLGGMLGSPVSENCRSAITLLEAAGPRARPAATQIVAALQNPDQEIRYLAVRSLAQMATNTPTAAKALQTVADDPNAMIRNTARRTLLTLAPDQAQRRPAP